MRRNNNAMKSNSPMIGFKKVNAKVEWSHQSWANLNADVSDLINKLTLLPSKNIKQFDKDIIEDIISELHFIRSDLRTIFNRTKNSDIGD